MHEHDALRKAIRENPEMADVVRKAMDEGKIVPISSISLTAPMVAVCSDHHHDIDGAITVLCNECGATLWMSPDTQKMILTRTGPVLAACLKCAPQVADKLKAARK